MQQLIKIFFIIFILFIFCEKRSRSIGPIISGSVGDLGGGGILRINPGEIDEDIRVTLDGGAHYNFQVKKIMPTISAGFFFLFKDAAADSWPYFGISSSFFLFQDGKSWKTNSGVMLSGGFESTFQKDYFIFFEFSLGLGNIPKFSPRAGILYKF